MSVFERLGFNFTDANNIVELSDGAKEYLNTIPKILNTWQEADLANNEVGGYFTNPVSNVANSIIAVSVSLMSATFNVNGDPLISSIYNLANTIQYTDGSADLFIEHTNRVSGVTSMVSDEVDEIFPYYITGMSVGQSIMYITNQVDGIQNNAPIMGTFTSLLVGEELQDTMNVVISYPQTILNSITITIGGIVPNTYPIKTSNLSNAVLQTMYDNVLYLKTTMDDRRNHDITFYRNSLQIMDEVDSLRVFTGMGETQDRLINNYIGSDKLLTRLNT